VYQLLQLFGFELLLRVADQAVVFCLMIIPLHLPGEIGESHGKCSNDIFGTSFEALISYLFNTCTQNTNIPVLGEEVLYANPPPSKVFIQEYIRNFTYFVYILTGIILFSDQLDEQFFFVYVYFSSLHVSSIQVLIIRRFNFILVCLFCMFCIAKFYVLLTVHLRIILFSDQLDTQFFFVFVYFSSLHVSSIQVLIIRRFNFILVCLFCMFCIAKFYVLLTVHLRIILFNDQLDTQFFFVFVYFSSLHVSSIQVLIIRRFNCILVCLFCLFSKQAKQRLKFINVIQFTVIGFKLGFYFLKMELSCRNIAE